MGPFIGGIILVGLGAFLLFVLLAPRFESIGKKIAKKLNKFN